MTNEQEQPVEGLPLRSGEWIQTWKGHRFYPFDPSEEDLDIEDIAHALSLICRWTGHTPWHYSVAQHSVLMADLARRSGYSPALQMGCLLHDATEAYINDMSRPMKRSAAMYGYNKCEDLIAYKIESRWCKPGIALSMATIKGLDNCMLMAEAYRFFPKWVDDWESNKPGGYFTNVIPANVVIIPGEPRLWEMRFRLAFQLLEAGESYTLEQREV